jgi:DtxR family Mn-dependent transcriptional regulator
VPKPLTASQEDYLEAVLAIAREHGAARVRDIALRLGVSMPSVSSALKTLAARDLVRHEPYRLVTLTEAGRARAEVIRRRHGFLRDLLAGVLGGDGEAAEAAACRIEHGLDDDLAARLRCFVEFLHRTPAGRRAVRQFDAYREKQADAPSAD